MALKAKSVPTIIASPRLCSRTWMMIVASSIRWNRARNFFSRARKGRVFRSGIFIRAKLSEAEAGLGACWSRKTHKYRSELNSLVDVSTMYRVVPPTKT